jgi:hypothetical protein
MVFLATTLESERISRRVMALSTRSEADGISLPALASGARSAAEGIYWPPVASGATSTLDPRVNLPMCPAFVERRVLTARDSSQPCPSSIWRRKRWRRNPNWNGEDKGGTRLELVGTYGTRRAEEVPPIFESTKVRFRVKKP